MKHDLNSLLAEVLTHFRPMPPIHIAWADLTADEHCGQARWTDDGHFIGVGVQLQRAPKYVVRYLIFHEVLHFALPPRMGTKNLLHHHRAFRVAERIWPDYTRAAAWLERHT